MRAASWSALFAGLSVLVAWLTFFKPTHPELGYQEKIEMSPEANAVNGSNNVVGNRNFFQSPMPPPTTDPRKKLAQLGIAYSAKDFDAAVISGELDVLELFFQAGYSPNRPAVTDIFSSTMAMKNNRVNFSEEIDLFKKYGLNFKAVSLADARLGMMILGRAQTQEEELYYYAATDYESAILLSTLKDKGADTSSLILALRHSEPYWRKALIPILHSLGR